MYQCINKCRRPYSPRSPHYLAYLTSMKVLFSLKFISLFICSPIFHWKPVKKRPKEQLQSWSHFLCKRLVSTHSISTLVIAVHMIALELPLKRNPKANAMYRAPQARIEELHVPLGLGTKGSLWGFPQTQWWWQKRWQQLTYQLQFNFIQQQCVEHLLDAKLCAWHQGKK